MAAPGESNTSVLKLNFTPVLDSQLQEIRKTPDITTTSPYPVERTTQIDSSVK
ncbi:hypothetical protein JYQ62_28125 [Nostoc sp. UHCC 0702]|nr:hypothetical protein JYQ62_28125 [Nostoc sp. UHCC 0702]